MCKKIKEIVKENREDIVGYAILVATFALGYKCGARHQTLKLEQGLAKVYLANPGLEKIMDTAIKTTAEKFN